MTPPRAMRVLSLSETLREEILASAREIYPLESCGLIEGMESKNGWRALAIHPARNLADDPSQGFLIDPQTHFDLLRALRGSERRIIGCYHSHPNGRPAPSETDRANAVEDGLIWLIVSGGAHVFALGAFLYSEKNAGFKPLSLTD